MYVGVVNDEDDLLTVADIVRGKERGVVFLSDEFKIGVDLKMAVDARVLVYCPGQGIKRPDRE